MIDFWKQKNIAEGDGKRWTENTEQERMLALIDTLNCYKNEFDGKETSKRYALKDENGNWLGQIVLTSDGFFATADAIRRWGIRSTEP